MALRDWLPSSNHEATLHELTFMSCRITAVVTAYRRIPETLATLSKLKACVPAPDEILVHVDCGGDDCRAAVTRAFPEIQILTSSVPVGPGGARNKLIAASRSPIVASFDDDSFPVDPDYFRRVSRLFCEYSEASILAAEHYDRSQRIPPCKESHEFFWVSDFVGCCCVYRRSAFLQTGGYVPLVAAYGMEEVDLAIRLHAVQGKILKASCLRVFHDTDYTGHRNPKLVAATIANAALLAYLRYPGTYWPKGFLQVCNNIFYALRSGRLKGITTGILSIPTHLWKHHRNRKTVPTQVLRSYFRLRQHPEAVAPPPGVLTISCNET